MLERFAHWIGWTTLYHVAWTAPVRPGEYKSGDMTLTVRPWITSANFREARAVVAKENGFEPSGVAITSVTRL